LATKLIFGCGYLGRRVAQRWLDKKHRVVAVTRSRQRAQELIAEGLEAWVGDVTQPKTLVGLPEAETVLYAVGFDRTAGIDKRTVYVQGLANVLDALPPSADRFVYVSSSSVYGQTTGEWVDENSTCTPNTESGQICLDAEQTLQDHPHFGPQSIILRMTGLYGPQRVPRREALAKGQPIAVAAEGFLNLIHVDDAAEAVLAAERWSHVPDVFLVSDDQPIQRAAYYAEAARLLGGPPPVIVPPSEDAPVTERAQSDKRASNRKLKQQLGLELRFPNYKIGLAEILAPQSPR
jgi:nucleoside-diphosphate-sugar epimerase